MEVFSVEAQVHDLHSTVVLSTPSLVRLGWKELPDYFPTSLTGLHNRHFSNFNPTTLQVSRALLVL